MSTPNPYLAGNFAPVPVETTAFDLPVTGTLPEHLDGRLLRNGPNPIGEAGAGHHWFLGSGMVHGIRLRDGRAEWYRNRHVRSPLVAEQLGERAPVAARAHAGFDFAPNTNVVSHGGRTYALVEAGARPYELTDELETIGACDFGGTLPGGYAAHPKRDPHTGELHAVSYYWGWGNTVQYSVLGVDGRIRRTVDVEVSGSPMMHDLALTDTHVVLFDLPCVFDLDAVAGLVPRRIPGLGALASKGAGMFVGRRRTPDVVASQINRRTIAAADPVLPYAWDAGYPARVGLLPRDGGSADVRWFDVNPCYVFHALNAYEDGDRTIVDVVRHPRMFDKQRLGPDEGHSTLDRWTIDRVTGKVSETRLDDHSQEFPRHDERLLGKRHRYAYTATFQGSRGQALLRHDTATGSTMAREFGSGHDASEFVFIPNAHDSAEDDGVVMGIVFDPDREASDVRVLDASTLEDVATVHLPARVPAGFHGNWAPTEQP